MDSSFYEPTQTPSNMGKRQGRGSPLFFFRPEGKNNYGRLEITSLAAPPQAIRVSRGRGVSHLTAARLSPTGRRGSPSLFQSEKGTGFYCYRLSRRERRETDIQSFRVFRNPENFTVFSVFTHLQCFFTRRQCALSALVSADVVPQCYGRISQPAHR